MISEVILQASTSGYQNVNSGCPDAALHSLLHYKEIKWEINGQDSYFNAFPYSDGGDQPPASDALLASTGYEAAFLCGGGPSVNRLPVEYPYRIDRLAMYRDTDLDTELTAGGRTES